MKTSSLDFTNNLSSIRLARWSIGFAVLSILMLLLLHFLSPEFSPSWRMVSEYANGDHEWALFVFFLSWGISSWCLASLLWKRVSSKIGKAGVILLFISGAGEIMAAFFDVNHPLHGLSGTLGIPPFVIAALLICYHLKNKDEWTGNKKTLLWSAHITWISLLLVIITMVLLITGFKNAGIIIGPNQKPPESLPDGVIALVGYANRILILAFLFWLILVAKKYLK
jgi:hypothetical protein